jgi:hypothetical protein
MFRDVSLAIVVGVPGFLRSLRNERGQTVAEYGLIMSFRSP